MLRQCFLKAGSQYGHTWLVTYLFLSFNSDSINTVCLSWNIKVFPKISQFGRESAFFLVIFGKLLRACFIVPEPAKLKIVRVRLVLNDVSVPFASCPPNRRHSEYYSCQTAKEFTRIDLKLAGPGRSFQQTLKYRDLSRNDESYLFLAQ